MSESKSSTPYDDSYKTLLTEHPRLIIPVVNEMFGKNYGNDAPVRFLPTEYHEHTEDSNIQKYASDACFQIFSSDQGIYLLECQSNSDPDMMLRMARYRLHATLQNLRMDGNNVRSNFPDLGCIYLRPPGREAAMDGIDISFPNGQEIKIKPVFLRVDRYSLRDIEEKELYFLLPFYAFNREKELRGTDENRESMEIYGDFEKITNILERTLENGTLTPQEILSIREITFNVVDGLSKDNPYPKKEVREIMGGTVYELATTKLYEEAKAAGEILGKAKGIAEGEARGIAKGEARGIAVGEARGEARGKTKGEERIVYRMILKGKKNALICDVTGFQLKRIEEMRKNFREHRADVIKEYGLDDDGNPSDSNKLR